MPSKPRQDRLEKDLAALQPALAHPDLPESRELLRAALRKSRSLAAAKAADLIRSRSLTGFEDDLRTAFERFLEDPIKSDPSCKAKLAALEALDFLESLDPAPFLTGVRTFQREPAWGEPVDTATGVRSRAAFGLARLGHPEFALRMADLLADPEATVRQAAAEAIAHRQDAAGAPLLQLKLRINDSEPQVTLACLSGLVALIPDWGIREAIGCLSSEDEEVREIGALALGQSRGEEAAMALLTALGGEVFSPRRAILLRALGMHRSEQALQALLRVIAEEARADARAAIEALVFRSFEPGLRERVVEAASRSRHDDLEGVVREAFRSGE
ncbi:MAG: HEAT repeat domain-containing protein [Myxococcales bacterium]